MSLGWRFQLHIPQSVCTVTCYITWPLLPLSRQFPGFSGSPAPTTQPLPVLSTRQAHAYLKVLAGPATSSAWHVLLPVSMGLPPQLLKSPPIGEVFPDHTVLSCFIFFHSIYHHWKHFVNWFIIHVRARVHTHTHTNGSLRTGT